MFRKLLVGFSLSVCVLSAQATLTTVDTTGMSDAQIAELKAKAAQMASDTAKAADQAKNGSNNLKDPSAIATFAATWGEQSSKAAEGFAHALGVAAKELNITVNDFLRSPAGILTAVIIIYKIAGAAIIHMIYGMIILMVGLFTARMLYLRLFTSGYEKVSYERFFGAWKGEKLVRRKLSFGDFQKDGQWMCLWVIIGILIATILLSAAFF